MLKVMEIQEFGVFSKNLSKWAVNHFTEFPFLSYGSLTSTISCGKGVPELRGSTDMNVR